MAISTLYEGWEYNPAYDVSEEDHVEHNPARLRRKDSQCDLILNGSASLLVYQPTNKYGKLNDNNIAYIGEPVHCLQHAHLDCPTFDHPPPLPCEEFKWSEWNDGVTTLNFWDCDSVATVCATILFNDKSLYHAIRYEPENDMIGRGDFELYKVKEKTIDKLLEAQRWAEAPYNTPGDLELTFPPNEQLNK